MLIPMHVPTVATVRHSIERILKARDYPCVAAIRSLANDECRIGVYENFGSGRSSAALASNLYLFLEEQRQTQSPFLSYWATFPDPIKGGHLDMDETEFENKLWHELSCLAAVAGFESKWDPRFSSDPESQGFCFSFAGSAFFVVGVHPRASRKSRQFPYPALVFNVYTQFETLMKNGQYDPMVRTIRRREKAYEGSVNPMVIEYGEKWESIQFSGARNPSDWRCPFRHGAEPLPEPEPA